MNAMPDDTTEIENPSSINCSLAGIKEDDSFIEAVSR
jgi:hypothetical protein